MCKSDYPPQEDSVLGVFFKAITNAVTVPDNFEKLRDHCIRLTKAFDVFQKAPFGSSEFFDSIADLKIIFSPEDEGNRCLSMLYVVMFLRNTNGSAKDKTRLADWFVKQQVPGTVEPITLRSDIQVERKVFELVQRIYRGNTKSRNYTEGKEAQALVKARKDISDKSSEYDKCSKEFQEESDKLKQEYIDYFAGMKVENKGLDQMPFQKDAPIEQVNEMRGSTSDTLYQLE